MFSSSPETRVAIRAVDPYGRLLDLFYYHQKTGTIESAFKTELANIEDSIKFLADNDRRIIDNTLMGMQIRNGTRSNYLLKDSFLIVRVMPSNNSHVIMTGCR
ncbi:MAG TPA: hypothetical protein VFR94_25995 [Nitrososphaeraceae archaeon]|nr:hypothetical protein [Nitrososphaeraceae archaeon]